MSVAILKTVFESAQQSIDWSLQLLKITSSKHNGTKYATRQILLYPAGKLEQFVKELTQRYLSSGKGALCAYTEVTDYDGTADSMKIYKLSSENPLISSEFESFISSVSDPDVEADAMSFQSAYILKGTIELDDDNDVPIKLISMQNPTTSLKHKFCVGPDNGKFIEISGPVLSLRTSIDVLILRNTVYFLTMAGENLFNMARAYKTVCHQAVLEVERAGFVSGIEVFKNVAESGHNPRKFVSFDRDRFESLKNTNTRKSMARQFSIPLDEENKFNASEDGSAEKIIKLLCKKGMIDPFDKSAVEVTSAKKWR